MEEEFLEWFKSMETIIHQSQFSDKDIAYSAWLQGKREMVKMIKEKLIELCPDIKDDTLTNPFIYRDVMNWYKELPKN